MHSPCPPDCCAGADEAGVAADDAPWDPGADADEAGADADEPGADADELGADADEPGPGDSVCPGPALLWVALGPVGASVVLKNGPCVRDDGATLVRVTSVVFSDV